MGASDGVPPNISTNLVATIFCACAGMIAAWTCFANMIRWLLGVLNPQSNQTIHWPSLRLLLEVATAAPLWLWAAKPDYEKTLIGVLEGATQATKVFDCFAGLDIERDVISPRKHLILEMPNVTPAWLRQFMQYLLFAQILYGRIHRHQKVDRTEVMLILDEMDQDATFEADRRFPDQMSPLAQMLRLGREYGIMAVIGLGRLNHASPYVLSEPQYHLIFNQSDADSVQIARRTLMLPPQADQMFPALTPGTCIAREAQGPWTHPMLVKIDYLPPGRDPLTQSYDTHPFIPLRALMLCLRCGKALSDLVAARRKGIPQTGQRTSHQLVQACSPAIACCSHTSLGACGGTLEAQPTIHPHRLFKNPYAVSWPSGSWLIPSKFVSVELACCSTRLPIRVGSSSSGSLPSAVVRGSITHQHVSHWIALCGEKKGYKAMCEWIAPGTKHPVDCAWEVEPNQC